MAAERLVLAEHEAGILDFEVARGEVVVPEERDGPFWRKGCVVYSIRYSHSAGSWSLGVRVLRRRPAHRRPRERIAAGRVAGPTFVAQGRSTAPTGPAATVASSSPIDRPEAARRCRWPAFFRSHGLEAAVGPIRLPGAGRIENHGEVGGWRLEVGG